jgi:1-acyl-sn-glycerol-3-phosphate acyltransferase
MRRAVLGAYCYLQFFLLAVLFLIPMGLVALFGRRDPGMRLRGRWIRRFGRATNALNPLWHFRLEGKKPAGIDTQPYVVVSNHQSSADPFLLAQLPWDMRWVGKVELFSKPLLGWLLSLSGDIPLHRGERRSVEAMLDECRATLAAGVSIMFFPEGTRSPDGRLQAFKDGAFQLAIEGQVPVLPVAVHGTRACRPKGSLWFGECTAVGRVLEPVPTAGLTLADLPQLKAQVREQIVFALAELEARAQVEARPRHRRRSFLPG